MDTKIFSVGPFEVNCGIVWNSAKQALIIDPGYDAADIAAFLSQNGLTVTGYLLTHGHTDHVCALAELHAKYPAPVYIHSADATWAFRAENQLPPWYPAPKKPVAKFIHPENPPRPAGTPPAEGNLKDPLHGRGGRSEATDGVGLITIADLSFQCLETPGHTPGCACYYFEQEKVIFTGDTLFKSSCGRTDLPGGDGRVLAQSLKKLATLPDDVTVHAGHGESTTIGHEKKTNFFMQQAVR